MNSKRTEGIEGLEEVQKKAAPERGGEIINANLLNTSQELEIHRTAVEKELGSGTRGTASKKHYLWERR